MLGMVCIFAGTALPFALGLAAVGFPARRLGIASLAISGLYLAGYIAGFAYLFSFATRHQ